MNGWYIVLTSVVALTCAGVMHIRIIYAYAHYFRHYFNNISIFHHDLSQTFLDNVTHPLVYQPAGL